MLLPWLAGCWRRKRQPWAEHPEIKEGGLGAVLPTALAQHSYPNFHELMMIVMDLADDPGVLQLWGMDGGGESCGSHSNTPNSTAPLGPGAFICGCRVAKITAVGRCNWPWGGSGGMAQAALCPTPQPGLCPVHVNPSTAFPNGDGAQEHQGGF